MIEIEGDHFLSADEVCALLEIKPSTLYAYVSRGRLRSYQQGMRRQRLYRKAEVETLARLRPSRAIELPSVDPWVDNH